MARTTSFQLIMAAALTATALSACGAGSPPPATGAPEASAPPARAAEPAADPVLLDIRDCAQLSGNPSTGARVFGALCSSCHAVVPGMNGSGPSLHGIVGRGAGTVDGFNYSQANRTSGITWTEQELFAYLERPAARIPGTTMVFQGIPQPQRRADLIAYLRTTE